MKKKPIKVAQHCLRGLLQARPNAEACMCDGRQFGQEMGRWTKKSGVPSELKELNVRDHVETNKN